MAAGEREAPGLGIAGGRGPGLRKPGRGARDVNEGSVGRLQSWRQREETRGLTTGNSAKAKKVVNQSEKILLTKEQEKKT